jgi:[ribosomal protein S5]-alanine N-acetyltransferase
VRAPGWPATLSEEAVTVRPLRMRDGLAWVDIRLRNRDWLARWEATPTGVLSAWDYWEARQTVSIYGQMLRRLRHQARTGTALPFGVVSGGRLVGQVTVSTIVRGAFNSGQVGYWVDQDHAGLGITPTALALVADHCFGPVGLHRIEANVRPENASSRRVMEKLGFREEGLHRRYLSIDGAYRDHICYALTTEDVPDGLVNHWRRVRGSRRPPAGSVGGSAAGPGDGAAVGGGDEWPVAGDGPAPGFDAGPSLPPSGSPSSGAGGLPRHRR